MSCTVFFCPYAAKRNSCGFSRISSIVERISCSAGISVTPAAVKQMSTFTQQWPPGIIVATDVFSNYFLMWRWHSLLLLFYGHGKKEDMEIPGIAAAEENENPLRLSIFRRIWYNFNRKFEEREMAHKALYRQFRPRRFEDLKGQEVVATVLRNQVSAANPPMPICFPFLGERERPARQRFSPARSTV